MIMSSSQVKELAVIDIGTTATAHSGIAEDLLAIHGFSGADAVASLHGVGKAIVINIAKKGTLSLSKVGDVKADMKSLHAQVTKFVCAGYGKEKEGRPEWALLSERISWQCAQWHPDKLLLIADFNARIRRDNDKWPLVMGKHRIGKCNPNAELLLALCSEFELIVTNIMFKQKDEHKTTWMHPRSRHWHMIDFIITRCRDKMNIHSVEPCVELPAGPITDAEVKRGFQNTTKAQKAWDKQGDQAQHNKTKYHQP
ncbi:hypothetical protein NP493_239g00007 [Ridgeia piscesae]|uniref:Uncharacterized protein n=1 Tax=Ridgeia piscesae TaxID=27915 RepID=A0AAD9NZF9_RIDPI|nr:hypothetical protein NP493_239g00007 [Ridgeia piscesae]